MPNFPTFSDLFRIGRDEVLARNAQISRDAVEREGMDANILVAAAAAMGDEVSGQLADLEASLFLNSAVGEVLDRLVYDRYGLVRKPASASIGSVQFSTPLPASATFSIPTGTLLGTATGTQFTTTEDAVYVAGSSGPLTVSVRSSLAGANQNAKIGTITSIISRISGAATGLTVTNAYATTGADAAETDDSLRDRARKFFTTARRGTMKALEEAALGVSGIQKATAFEVLDSLGRPARICQLVVSDAFTEQYVNYAIIPARYQTQSQAISSSVFQALSDVRAAGTYVQVIVANTILQSVQLTLAFQAGADVNSSALQARVAVVNYINALPPGTALSIADLLSKIQLVPGISYSGGEVLSPAGDVHAKPLQVIRTSLALVSAVAAQTDHPLITGTNPDAYSLATG